MLSADETIDIYKDLTNRGIRTWLVGGWGVDALLQEHTRPHKDLDLIMLVEDVARMSAHLVHQGFELKEVWSENQWTIDGQGTQILTAFVLMDAQERELDFHAMHLDERGDGIPAWEVAEGFTFTKHDLSGVGTVAGAEVRCITAEKQMLCHTGYELPAKQVPDLVRLQEKFSIRYPEELTVLRLAGKSES